MQALIARSLAEEEKEAAEDPGSGVGPGSPTAAGLRRSKRHKRHDQEDMERTEGIPGIGSQEQQNNDPGMPNPDDDHGNSGLFEEDPDLGDTEDDDNGDGSRSSSNEDAESTKKDTKEGTPNTDMRDDFQDYCKKMRAKQQPLTPETISSIKLMDALRRKKAPMNAYEEIMEWHLKETGHLPDEGFGLKDTTEYFTRTTLMRQLAKRYNMEGMYPKEKKVWLLYSKSVVSIPYCEAKDCILSLLTDPRIHDENYLFFDNDPLAPPPEERLYVEDLNSGDAYRASFEKMIKEKGEVLLPVPLYIDSAVTGQFSSLPITALKLSLGIWDRETRDEPWAWREMGFIPEVRKEKSRGRKIFKESQHLESWDMVVMDGEGDSLSEDADSDYTEDEDGAVKAQDFHTMLDAILESFVDLQRTGFIFDLVYKGKVYTNIKFVIFVPFIKCDTEEADTLCGKYLTRNKHVKHLCRYCHCPTNMADDPRANYPMKTQAQIQKLCEKGDLVRLKAISQQCIKNAWYKVTFHAANGRGIHGACPSEMLHAILLGIFKYLRDIFFDNMGKTESAQLPEDINGLARMYGSLFTHQSDRDLPNTNFSKGIRKGKLMAKEYRGVLLVMAAVLRSTEGKKLLKRKKKFGGDTGLRDWSWLVEMLLEWEAYLNEKKMLVKDVKRLQRKNRFIMYIIKNVAKRYEGMGLKVRKAQDMKQVGCKAKQLLTHFT